ncbi:murein hydrolase activator EnvC family protein [Thermomonas flagellata]|uniref:murein hydrolase activator EnvC family protein n=1 Tax=Thermomonas flagellata TaxID=2888524 RepID=UPI001F05025D|nr:peptidoglycan DD-metalloendopeptidase family protein [Thermomonas flagellata]
MRRAGLLACLLLASAAAAPAQQREEAEQRLREVRGQLQSVAAERRRLEGQRGAAGRDLRAADAAVAAAEQRLRQVQQALQEDAAALARLQARRAALAGDAEARRAQLAALLRAAAQAGPAPALQALLAQDRLADAQRRLAYQGYLQRAQAEQIRRLGAELAEVDALQAQIAQRRASLDALTQQQQAQLQQLQQARRQRAQLLAELDAQYRDKARREQALGRDAQALQALLARLRAAAAEAQREAARAKAEAERQARAGIRPPPRPTPAAPIAQVGGLSWPVAGGLLAGYGGRMPDGRRSDGVLIAAGAGTPIKAVADGTVVFADWMTGYGNILIIDHGNGYMSLYAHADGLLKPAGTAVRRGEPVATVGTSGGQDRPALYFELRRNGSPVDPRPWLGRP